MTPVLLKNRYFLYFIILGCSFLTSCSSSPKINSVMNSPIKTKPELNETNYTTPDHEEFGYKKWLPKEKEPEIVIVGVHGISGHASDFTNLAKHFIEEHNNIALYAPELRGQGHDPKLNRQGDIPSHRQWQQDLYTFTKLLRELHPEAKILWFGESMGSMIITHAYADIAPGQTKPDGLVILSPILDITARVATWKKNLVKAAGFLLPKLRLSLENLSNGEKVIVTKQDIHEQQTAKNPWHIQRYTLRLIITLGEMSDKMLTKASKVDAPLLIVHSGNDLFTKEHSVTAFCSALPAEVDHTRHFHKDSYHLLMYDHKRSEIFRDISKWLERFK